MSQAVRKYRRRLGQAPGNPGQAAQGTPTLLFTTAPPATAQSGVAFSTNPVVQLTDGLGNNVAQAGVVINATVSPNASVIYTTSPSPATTDATGKVTYTQIILTSTAATYTLFFTAVGYTQVSALVGLSAGTPSPAQFTASVPSTGRVGVVTTITIQARDSASNACTSASPTVVVNINGANTGAATATNNNNGTYTATYTPSNAGTDTITITADGTAITGSPFTSTVSASTPSARILSYVKTLPTLTTHRCIVGQMYENTLNGGFTSVNKLQTDTGKMVGMMGMAYTYNVGEINAVASQAWTTNKSMLTGICTFTNPQTGGPETDTTAAVHNAITSGTAANSNFFGTQLPNLATRLQSMRSAIPGICTLIRPFREQNLGTSFWWNNATAADFITLWKMTYNYLVTTAGLGDTLLFDFNVFSGPGNYTTFYPGSGFADIVSFDYYGDHPATDCVTVYNSLLTLNKPIHMAEFGPHNAAGPIAPNSFDNTVVLNAIKTNFPKLWAVSSWNGQWAWDTQLNASTLMNDAVVATATDVQAPTR